MCFQVVPPKSKTRLRFRLASKFTNQEKSAISSLGLVEGNSTNTVNTVEDTEYSSNVEKKIVEVTTFNNTEVEVKHITLLKNNRDLPQLIVNKKKTN